MQFQMSKKECPQTFCPLSGK